MPINSRAKGKRGELEATKYLGEAFGFRARRSQQFSGRGDSSADIICDELPDIHFEVKRVEALNIDKALDQAIADAKDGRLPIVLHRKDRTRWKITLEFDRVNMIKIVEAFKQLCNSLGQ